MSISSLNSTLPADNSQLATSSQYQNGKFRNQPHISNGSSNGWKILKRWLFEKRIATEPSQPIPLQTISRAQLDALPSNQTSVFRLGHSSVLLKVAGDFWLLDPVFSKRASPLSFVGPKRFHPAPIKLDELPPIKGVLISHNHYDHLDKSTIKKLHSKVEHFVVPLAVGAELENWGVAADKITELDWWQHTTIGDVQLIATPSQHFSGRGLSDGNKTLWSSWVIKQNNESIFFSGDSGYFPGFKQIGERFGPFDLTIMETGAWDEMWPDVHMTPEQTLRAHLDLRGKRLMPVHNSTFDLAFHRWYDPMERISALANKHDVPLITPVIGQHVELQGANVSSAWWRDLMIGSR